MFKKQVGQYQRNKKPFNMVLVTNHPRMIKEKLSQLNIINYEYSSYPVVLEIKPNDIISGTRVIFYNRNDFFLFKLKHGNLIYRVI